MIIFKQHTYSTPVTNIQNTIYINNSKFQLDKVKYKIYYWHLINNIVHIPKAITKWDNITLILNSKTTMTSIKSLCNDKQLGPFRMTNISPFAMTGNGALLG